MAEAPNTGGSGDPPAEGRTAPRPPGVARSAARQRLAWLVGLGLLAAVAWWYREPLRQRLEWTLLLANEAPPPELVESAISAAPDGVAAVRAAWEADRLVHRQAAVRSVRRVVPPPAPLPSPLDALIHAAVLDPDLTVRETALRDLRDRRHPHLPALVAAQLRDVDPQVRLLGLQLLKAAEPSTAVPLAATLLDDPHPVVVVSALKLLERVAGQDWAVKLADLSPQSAAYAGSDDFPAAGLARARAAAERARTWWQVQRGDFPAPPAVRPEELGAAARPLPAPDFTLPDLEGRRVRLRDLRGQVVVLNFWTTWCTACLGEIPALVALQTRWGDRIRILGVSLDAVPDSHGHIGGHAAEAEHTAGEAHAEDHDHSHPARPEARALERVREKVRRTVRARGINYPVLLDERNDAGARYLGGELPTTVIVDAAGRVRRRFIGARSLATLEAMVSEAAHPAPQPAAARPDP